MSDAFSSGSAGSDTVTETTSQNIFSRIAGAFVGAAFGLVLFLVAIGLLVWNESRAVDAVRGLGQAAREVVEASPGQIVSAQDGHLVHLTGPLVAHGALSDPEMGVTRDGLVHLRRTVEMFQWEQHEETHSQSSVGGTKTTQTTYTYTKKWADHPVDSSNFKGNHVNPEMPIQSQVFTSQDVTMADRKLAPKLLDEMDAYTAIAAPADAPDGYRREGARFYKGANPDAPSIGDVRVSFGGVPAQPVSVVAGQSGPLLTPFKTKSGYKVGLVAPGDVDADDMVAQKRSSEKTLTWILRGVGFLCFFIALLLLGSPLGVLADVLPFLGTLVSGGIFFFALVFAIPLTLVTIALSWVAVRPLLGVGLLVAAALVVFAWHRLRPRKAKVSFLPA